MDGSTLIVNLAYAVLVSATFTRTILWLRVLLISGALLLVTYSLIIGNESVAAWNLIILALHSWQLVRYIRARRAVSLTDEDEYFRRLHFPSLDRFDFYTLWSLGEEAKFEDSRLTSADEEQNTIALVLDGNVEVRRRGEVVAELGHGALVGEMSYVSGASATADSFAVGPVRLRVWEQRRLAALDQISPVASRAFQEFIQRDLAAKVL